MNEILSGHFPQAKNDSLWEVKQDIFDRVFSQVDNIHNDPRLPAMLKNISLYLESEENATYSATKFGGISKTETYNISIKEYVKYDNDNWVFFIDMFNRVSFNKDGEATDLNLENPYSQIEKMAIGCIDGAIFIAPGGAERVIALTNDFKMKKLGISILEIKSFMDSKPISDGYKVNEFDSGVYLLDSPAPLFANDSVEYRDGDYVGLWLSFGTLIKYDLRDLNVFNIDGTKVGVIDSDVTSKSVKILKMLTNTAYGYASIIFNKKSLLNHLMKFSKRYVYESNIQNETRVCVDNILFNLTNTGILGLVYDEFEAVEEFPMFAYDETEVSVTRKRGTVIKFKYGNDYIYMMLDLEKQKMYFMSYHGRINDYFNSEFEYSVKVMNDLWVSKVNDINSENFILFTGFPNLQSNKVLDFYFDNTIESFSSLDKQFALDVNEFDGFYEETVATPSEYSYDKGTDFIHVYGNNPVALVSGLLNYESVKPASLVEQEKFELRTNAIPDIKTFIDPSSKTVYMFEPVVNANGYLNRNVSELRVLQFINNYIARWKNGEDPKDWIKEAEYGGYVWDLVLSYFSLGWTFYKEDDNTFKCIKLPTIRRSLSYAGSVAEDSLREAKSIIARAELNSEESSVDKLAKNIKDGANNILKNYKTEIEQITMGFAISIFSKMSFDANIVDPDFAVFEFKKFEGSDDMYINNAPTGQFANHAILFEDTFNNMILKTTDVYDSFMSYSESSESVYCPYLTEFNTFYRGNIVELLVSSDMSTSRAIMRNKRAGIEVYKAIKSGNSDLNIGGVIIPESEAYNLYIRISYFGIRDISGMDFNVFRFQTRIKMSERLVELLSDGLKTEMQNDWSDFDGAYEKYEELGGKATPVEIDMETGQPLYLAIKDNKLKVSLDGIIFLDAPIGTDEFDISGVMRISSRTSIMRTLNTLLYQKKNELNLYLYNTQTYVENDIYSIAVEKVEIDTSGVYSDGTADVTAVFRVDNGQAVLENSDFIYSKDETFAVTKTVNIDGFKRIEPENGEYGTIKVLIPFEIVYYTLVPTRNNEIYETAAELMLHDSAYRVKMNLPMFVSMSANEYRYVDRDEASEDGLDIWFNFTGEN